MADTQKNGSDMLAEAAAETTEHASSAPGSTWFQRWRSRMLLLAALAGVATLPDHDTGQSWYEDTVDVENERPILYVAQDGWDFQMYRAEKVRITDEYGQTLYHFIKGTINKKNLLPEGMDELTLINAIIQLCAGVNSPDLNDFNSINGTQINFPDYVLITKRTNRFDHKSSYAELLSAVEKDGFNVKDSQHQQANYDRAMQETVEIPQSEFYFRKSDDVDYSPNRLYADAIEKLDAWSRAFKARSGGWVFSYTDVLISPEAQRARYKAINEERKRQGKKPFKVAEDTTHTTGCTLDVPNGRFKTPEGEEVTYKDSPEHRDKIKNELQDILVETALENGVMVYVEGTHYHVYIPKTEKRTEVIDFGFRNKHAIGCTSDDESDEEDEAIVTADDITSPSYEAQTFEATDFDGKAESVIASMIANNQPWSRTVIDSQLDAIDKEFANFLKEKGVNSGPGYHTLLYKYTTLDPALEAAYGDMNEKQIQAEINKLSEEKKKANNSKISDLARVRDFKRYNPYARRLITVVQHMSPEDVERHAIFRGSVFDSPSKHSFYDLEGVWEYKRDEHGKKADAEVYNHIIEALKGENHSVDLQDWFAQQDAACNYFKAHSQILGFEPEMAQYIGPAVIFAVIQGEFVSEFDGKTYFDLAPTLFPSVNLVYGPAVNDSKVSGGVVQMTSDTFNRLMGQKYETLLAIQDHDPSYKLSLPRVTKEHKKGDRIVRRNFDTNDMADAMLTDLPSQLFFAALVTADHVKPAFQVLMRDKNFKAAWDAASEEKRYLFIGSLAPLAINSGPGKVDNNNGASGVAKILLNNVDSKDLTDYVNKLPDAAREKYGKSGKATTTSRNADRGRQTMQEFINREVKDAEVPKPQPKPEPQSQPLQTQEPTEDEVFRALEKQGAKIFKIKPEND